MRATMTRRRWIAVVVAGLILIAAVILFVLSLVTDDSRLSGIAWLLTAPITLVFCVALFRHVTSAPVPGREDLSPKAGLAHRAGTKPDKRA